MELARVGTEDAVTILKQAAADNNARGNNRARKAMRMIENNLPISERL